MDRVRNRQKLTVLLGVLFISLLAGCSSVSLADVTLEPSPTDEPNLSMDTIAFIGESGNLWLVDTSGENQEQLTTTGKATAPAWSPDGETLAYVSRTSQAVLYTPDTNVHHEIGPRIERLRDLAWAPDERYLILESGTSVAAQIHVLDVATEQVVGTSEALGYAWAPGGDRIAVGVRSPLEEPISIEPGDSVSLVVWDFGQESLNEIFVGTSEGLYFPDSWLPDGRLLYRRIEWDEADDVGKTSYWTVEIVSGVPQEPQPAENLPPTWVPGALLQRLPESFRDPATTHSFSWSADRETVVFQSGTWPDERIYLFDWVTGGEPRLMVTGSAPTLQP